MTLFQIGVIYGARLTLLLGSVGVFLLGVWAGGSASAPFFVASVSIFLVWLVVHLRTNRMMRLARAQAGSPVSSSTVSGVDEIVARIGEVIPDLKTGSLVVFGEVFGGRIDNIHTVIGARVGNSPGQLEVLFDFGEVLQIWEPREATFDAGTFRVQKASRVRWEWTNCGRPESPENRHFNDYRLVEGRVEVSTNAPWRDTPRSVASFDGPAVELVWPGQSRSRIG